MKPPKDNDVELTPNVELEDELRNLPSPSAPTQLCERLLADIPSEQSRPVPRKNKPYTFMARAAAVFILLAGIYRLTFWLAECPVEPWTLASTAPEYILYPVCSVDECLDTDPGTILPPPDF